VRTSPIESTTKTNFSSYATACVFEVARKKTTISVKMFQTNQFIVRNLEIF